MLAQEEPGAPGAGSTAHARPSPAGSSPAKERVKKKNTFLALLAAEVAAAAVCSGSNGA